MNKGGIGVGSASIILVFAVLCLTVFSLITFLVAGNEKALADAEAELVIGYYEADALAEQILAKIVEADDMPDMILGVEISSYWDMWLEEEIVHFLCPMPGTKALYVKAAVYCEPCGILSWRIIDMEEWVFDDTLDVWSGDWMEFPEFPDIADFG
jgi:hypothetical protein